MGFLLRIGGSRDREGWRRGVVRRERKGRRLQGGDLLGAEIGDDFGSCVVHATADVDARRD